MKWSHLVTDFDNRTFETGRTLAVLVVVTGVLLQIYDVTVQHAHFDARAYGMGLGGILIGLATYLFCDAKGRQAANMPPDSTDDVADPAGHQR